MNCCCDALCHAKDSSVPFSEQKVPKNKWKEWSAASVFPLETSFRICLRPLYCVFSLVLHSFSSAVATVTAALFVFRIIQLAK